MKSNLDRRLLILNTEENCDYMVFMKNEIKETKKIMYSDISKINICPRNDKNFDIIIDTKSDTVYLKLIINKL